MNLSSALGLKTALDQDDQAVMLFDAKGRVSYANQAADALFGLPANGLIGKSSGDFVLDPNFIHLALPVRYAMMGRTFEGDVSPPYDRRTWHVRCWPCAEGAVCRLTGSGGVGREFLARHDNLTGLSNRQHFLQRLTARLEQGRREERPVCVAYLDLDRFKWLNDTFGHAAGDALLMAVAGRLRHVLPQDSLCGRLGGDEFAVCLPVGTAENEGKAVFRAAIDRLGQPYGIGGDQITVPASGGMAGFPAATDAASELLDMADFALRLAKERGRARLVTLTKRMTHDFRHERQLTRWLHEAIARGMFDLHYQPLVEAAGGRVIAFEALLRAPSDHPRVTVRDIIKLAEREGLMPTLGRWVLEAVCAQVAAWRRRGYGIPVAVNLAPAQLLATTFADEAGSLLQRHGLTPNDVTFEIAEGLAASLESTTRAAIDRLLHGGFRLAIDDFGSEYASIGRVARLPIHQVKFDGSLVAHLTGEARQARLVGGLIALFDGRGLGLDVVAEGIENDVLRARAADAGANLLQGFGLHRPMPAERALRVL